MVKRKKEQNPDLESNHFMQVSKPVNFILSVLFIALALCCFVPFVFVVIISFTDQTAIFKNGYQFFPEKWTLEAYKTLFENGAALFNAVFVSIFVTVAGTVIGVLLNALMGYVLSRKRYVFRKAYTMLVFIPMLFNGGLTASYLVNIHVTDSGLPAWRKQLTICASECYGMPGTTFILRYRNSRFRKGTTM